MRPAGGNGGRSFSSSPDAFMAGEVRKYTKIVRDLGLKLN
jgi:hypothetical protein